MNGVIGDEVKSAGIGLQQFVLGWYLLNCRLDLFEQSHVFGDTRNISLGIIEAGY